MKKYEMLPTEENIIETLYNDPINRNKDIVYFYNILQAQESASAIAIDGRWGSGKTFFVRQTQMVINALNPSSTIDEETKAKATVRLPFPKNDEENENYSIAIYYDAWENDNDTDPVLSLVYEIIKQLGINYDFDDNGNTFDACRYLDRFFDMRLSLPSADKTAFYREMGLDSGYILEKVSRKVIDTYNMELREATRFYRQVKTAAYEPTHDSRKWDFGFSDGKGKKLLLMCITPILVGLKIVDISLYNDFVNGKNSKPLMDIYKESDLEDWLCSGLLNRDEAFEEIEGKTLVTVEQKLQSLYEAIFVTEYTNGVYHTMIGDYEFDSNSKHFVRSIESMLSVYADYEL